jgi:hypothetical protein
LARGQGEEDGTRQYELEVRDSWTKKLSRSKIRRTAVPNEFPTIYPRERTRSCGSYRLSDSADMIFDQRPVWRRERGDSNCSAPHVLFELNGFVARDQHIEPTSFRGIQQLTVV